MLNQSIDSAKSKMEQTISFVKSEISKIRTGRANTEMFNNILVNYYDNETPLNQVANIAALDAITISIQPFDKTVIDDIEKAILESDLGFNPSNNGNSIMITFQPLSAERRQELVKVASKIIEDGRISVRNIRREIIQSAKRIEDEQNISEDNMKTFLDDIQEVTDSFVTRLNVLQKEKELEINVCKFFSNFISYIRGIIHFSFKRIVIARNFKTRKFFWSCWNGYSDYCYVFVCW